MVILNGGAVSLRCDVCGGAYRPRPRVVDVTATAEQRTVLDFELRRRASRQGWTSMRIAPQPWHDRCPREQCRAS